jgi:hypothetical protein
MCAESTFKPKITHHEKLTDDDKGNEIDSPIRLYEKARIKHDVNFHFLKMTVLKKEKKSQN